MPARRIVFICPTVSQPRHHRRAIALKPFFDKAIAVCFQRGYYAENTWPEGIERILLPKAEDAAYLKRLLVFPKALSQVRKEVKSFQGPQVVYAFGIDCGILAILSKRRGDMVIWEVGDLVTPYVAQSWKRAIIRALEKWILRKSDRMVNVCQGMFEDYFKDLDPTSRPKLIVIENRLPDRFRVNGGPTKSSASKPLRLGWSGALRNPEMYDRLLAAVAADEGRRVVLKIWGGGPGAEIATKYSKESPYIKMEGTYKEEPDVVRAMYEQTDVQIVLEDPTNINMKFALPNRFSQCLVYETPMIAPNGSDMATRMIEFGAGMGIDERNEDWSKLFDKLADGVLVNQWISNMRGIPDDLRYLDSRPLVDAVKAWIEKT